MTQFFDQAATMMQELRQGRFPERVSSDEKAILIAYAVALRADCTRRRVGAVIFDPHGRVVGTGRNGAPPGYHGCLSDGVCPRGRFDNDQVSPGAPYEGGARCIAIHAESNALLFSSPNARRGGTIAITDAPCDDCSVMLAGSGLARAIWPAHADGHWIVREQLLGYPHRIGKHYGG